MDLQGQVLDVICATGFVHVLSYRGLRKWCRAHGAGRSLAPFAKFVDSSSCSVGADSPSLLGGSWVVTSQVGFISRIIAVMVYN